MSDARRERRLRQRRLVSLRRRLIGSVVIVGLGLAAGIVVATRSDRATAVARPLTSALRASRATPELLHPPGPIPGYLLIADRGNNRMLLVDSAHRVYWRYPGGGRQAMPFVFDDDTFFGPDRREVISNQEDQDTIQIVSFPGKKVIWRYGHVNVKSGAPGYLNTPDDAYLLPNHLVSVADAYNCRILFISRAHRIIRQYGTTRVCRHDPPTYLGSVNGATPLSDGGTLISEITGSWIDYIGPTGRLRWDIQAPVSYPSDPQLLGPNRILLADYAKPGAAIIMSRAGRVLWRYGPQSGAGELDHPSLATQIAPGMIAINDDFRDRVVIVNLHTKRIVWQYGHTDIAGRGGGYLNTPDGLDLLPTRDAQAIPALRRLLLPKRTTSVTRAGARPATSTLDVTVPFSLTSPVERGIALGAGRSVVVAGGLDAAGSSTSGVFRLDPASGRLTALGSFPNAFHDAAGAIIGSSLYAFGGGAAASSADVQRFNLATHRSSIVAQLPHPLSDLAAATSVDGTYLIGGFDGTRPRSEIYRTRNGTTFAQVARLPTGLRYPAVATVGRLLVIAGGIGQSGTSRDVFVLDTATNKVRLIGRLPRSVAHAEAFTFGRDVFVAGGADAAGHTVGTVAEVDPASGAIRAVAANLPIRDAPAAAVHGSVLLIGGATAAGTTATVHRVAAR